MAETRHLTVTGRVQGVAYRAWTIGTAKELGLVGWVRNRQDGAVEITARGEPDELDALATRCRRGPPMAQVQDVVEATVDDDPDLGPYFVQIASA
ncbi:MULTISPECIES: acylphosphatase [Thalassobaculum]|uniref:acylphosphatase n=1 Tax=Thalassobaculum litoreum DSM 18839 TaxID=1123362 RepID=A0A8G2F016_9PROT|nr:MULTISPECIES: acylphosphatase [Thalassobaculum]SDG47107.1 acylphosphatase [Thalassobaculum litoreum DSM 18839]